MLENISIKLLEQYNFMLKMVRYNFNFWLISVMLTFFNYSSLGCLMARVYFGVLAYVDKVHGLKFDFL